MGLLLITTLLALAAVWTYFSQLSSPATPAVVSAPVGHAAYVDNQQCLSDKRAATNKQNSAARPQPSA